MITTEELIERYCSGIEDPDVLTLARMYFDGLIENANRNAVDHLNGFGTALKSCPIYLRDVDVLKAQEHVQRIGIEQKIDCGKMASRALTMLGYVNGVSRFFDYDEIGAPDKCFKEIYADAMEYWKDEARCERTGKD